MTSAEKPSVIVQHDWDIDVRAQTGKFWLSIRPQPGAPTKHGTVVVSPEGLRTDLNAAVKHDAGVLTVTSEDLPGHVFEFQSPEHSYPKVLKRKILSMDISPSGALGVCAADQGQLSVLNFETPTLNRVLSGHVGDVNTCRFFPSGEVVLSGGSDLTLRIWSVADGSCARTLKGHAGGVLGTALIGRGRNFLSCSRDGSVRLWDCASATCIRGALAPAPDPALPPPAPAVAVNDIVVLAAPAPLPAAAAPDEREAGTEGMCAVAACADGHLRVIDLRSAATAHDATIAIGAEVHKVAVASEHVVVAGCSNASVVWWDLRANRMLRTGAATASVSSLTANTTHVFVGDEEGQVRVFGAGEERAAIRTLTGADIDPISGLHLGAGAVHTACRDAAIRRYRWFELTAK